MGELGELGGFFGCSSPAFFKVSYLGLLVSLMSLGELGELGWGSSPAVNALHCNGLTPAGGTGGTTPNPSLKSKKRKDFKKIRKKKNFI